MLTTRYATSSHVRAGITLLSAATFLCAIASVATAQESTSLVVTLLGTGRPDPVIDRFGPSTLVEAGGERLLFDAGRGASQRLWQLKVPLGQLNALFLTHLHSDHTVGIPDLWLTGWLPTPYGRRAAPLEVWGPAGTRGMIAGLRTAYAWDLRVRAQQEGLPVAGAELVAHEIHEGVVFNRHGVRVTAFLVDHGGLLKPAFGYRVDYAGHSVVVSGDTRYSQNLIKFAAGTDLLVHEVAATDPDLLTHSPTAPVARRILGWHSSPEDAAHVFQQVHPKLAVFTHVVLLTTDAAFAPPPLATVLARATAIYSGPLVVGEDLMSFVVGDSVRVRPRAVPASASTP